MYTIYVIEHSPTGKSYVGKTRYPEGRRMFHFQTPSNKVLIGQEISRLGASQFTFRKVDYTDTSGEACKLERIWIHLLEANDPQFGYNHPNVYPLEPLPAIQEIKQKLHSLGR